MPHMGRNDPREVERRLGYRERIARVVSDANCWSELLAQRHKFATGEILMVLDADDLARSFRHRRVAPEFFARRRDALEPRRIGHRPIAAQHAGQRHADQRRVEHSGNFEQPRDVATLEPGAHDRHHAERCGAHRAAR